MIREYLEDLRDHWNDGYWRADHPEVTAVIYGLVGGLLSLLFTWLQALVTQRVRLPETRDV